MSSGRLKRLTEIAYY